MELFPSFFPVSQWEAWNLFQTTSDGATRFGVTEPFINKKNILETFFKCKVASY